MSWSTVISVARSARGATMGAKVSPSAITKRRSALRGRIGRVGEEATRGAEERLQRGPARELGEEDRLVGEGAAGVGGVEKDVGRPGVIAPRGGGLDEGFGGVRGLAEPGEVWQEEVRALRPVAVAPALGGAGECGEAAQACPRLLGRDPARREEVAPREHPLQRVEGPARGFGLRRVAPDLASEAGVEPERLRGGEARAVRPVLAPDPRGLLADEGQEHEPPDDPAEDERGPPPVAGSFGRVRIVHASQTLRDGGKVRERRRSGPPGLDPSVARPSLARSRGSNCDRGVQVGRPGPTAPARGYRAGTTRTSSPIPPIFAGAVLPWSLPSRPRA